MQSLLLFFRTFGTTVTAQKKNSMQDQKSLTCCSDNTYDFIDFTYKQQGWNQ
jgi:hypothetical protein